MEPTVVTKESGELRVVAYPGDNKVLLAMSITDGTLDSGTRNLAGFAIWRRTAAGTEQVLSNRISFESGVSKATTAKTRIWTPSDQAPFQKFRWIDVPPDGFGSNLTYRVQALYFKSTNGYELSPGPEVTLDLAPAMNLHSHFRPGFTRGFIASQAYVDKFHNADIRPAGPKTPDFSTAPFEAQYKWLGADARERLFAFIADCEADPSAKIDVFAYDLDEPDIIAAICRLGQQSRLRAILDNASLHVKAGAPEIKAAAMIIAAAGKAAVKQGHFSRFQHNKVFIKRDASGQAQRVLFGSMNFSVRGVYVQANNVIEVDDATVAGMFARAFDVAWAGNVKVSPFVKDPISSGYMPGSEADTPELPKFSLALSPHKDSSVSLGPMSTRIQQASSSVLFAVMEPTGQGPVLAALRAIASDPIVFSYGTVETSKGLAVQKPDGAMGAITPFAFLAKNVPPPFNKEFGGGPGMHIHDKFVVVDFNRDNPTVFTGSSNLAAGGEEANGDSLAMIEDAAIAQIYAIEAVAIFDHFHFRQVMSVTPKAEPFTLWFPGKAGAPTPWWKSAYDPHAIQLRDRCLFAGVPLPDGIETTKTVDWKALTAAKPKPAAASPAAAAKTATSKSPAKKPASSAKKAPKRTSGPSRKSAASSKTARSTKAKARPPAPRPSGRKPAAAKAKPSGGKKNSRSGSAPRSAGTVRSQAKKTKTPRSKPPAGRTSRRRTPSRQK